MNFNFNRAKVEEHKPEKDGIKIPRKSREEKIAEKIEVEKDNSLFLIYIMKNYCFPETKSKDYNIRIWSKVDGRYVFNIYTDDADRAVEYILRKFRKKDSTVLDIREATQKELIEKYRMRFL